MNKKIIYIDMDGVLVDFEKSVETHFEQYPYQKSIYKNHVDLIHNVFLNAKPIEGAIEAVKKLEESGKYELFIATAAPWGNTESSSHKRIWIEQYFGKMFKRKMFITHRKDLLMGDYLIDDRTKNGAGEFRGELLLFGYSYENKKMNEYPTWESILEKLL
jgi:5'(3')-deoxyribonucleotidase